MDGHPSAEPGDRREAAGTAAPELVGLHGDVDAAHATLYAAWPKAPLAPSQTSSLQG